VDGPGFSGGGIGGGGGGARAAEWRARALRLGILSAYTPQAPRPPQARSRIARAVWEVLARDAAGE
jgi:hypothetical protein